MQMDARPVTGFRALPEKCPLFPKILPAAHRIQLFAFSTRTLYTGIISQPAAHAQAEAQYRVSSARAHQKRGPPSFASLN